MPRAIMQKTDILARVYKLKTALFNGEHPEKSADWHDGAHESLNKILDILQEWRAWKI